MSCETKVLMHAFSVNMLGILTSGIIIAPNKTAFLTDSHHPSYQAHNITADALKLGFLLLREQGGGLQHQAELQATAVRYITRPQPLLQPGLLVPNMHWQAVCFLMHQPQFGTSPPVLVHVGCQNKDNLTAACSLSTPGKADPNKAGRRS
jgi:hypothetical protein